MSQTHMIMGTDVLWKNGNLLWFLFSEPQLPPFYWCSSKGVLSRSWNIYLRKDSDSLSEGWFSSLLHCCSARYIMITEALSQKKMDQYAPDASLVLFQEIVLISTNATRWKQAATFSISVFMYEMLEVWLVMEALCFCLVVIFFITRGHLYFREERSLLFF